MSLLEVGTAEKAQSKGFSIQGDCEMKKEDIWKNVTELVLSFPRSLWCKTKHKEHVAICTHKHLRLWLYSLCKYAGLFTRSLYDDGKSHTEAFTAELLDTCISCEKWRKAVGGGSSLLLSCDSQLFIIETTAQTRRQRQGTRQWHCCLHR